MIGRTNSASTGGLSAHGAILNIIAPIESTVVFSKNNVIVNTMTPEQSRVLDSDSTLAAYYYAISPSNFGSWDISVNKGYDDITETVVIDTHGEYEYILRPRKYLFKAGIGNIDSIITSSKQDNGSVSINTERIAVSYSGSGSYCTRVATASKLDMTDYFKVVFDVYVSAAPQNDYRGRYLVTDNSWIQGGTYGSDTYAARTMMAVGERKLVYIDVSNIDSTKYISVSGVWRGEIYNIYLER